jgi:hypothetical protein
VKFGSSGGHGGGGGGGDGSDGRRGIFLLDEEETDFHVNSLRLAPLPAGWRAGDTCYSTIKHHVEKRTTTVDTKAAAGEEIQGKGGGIVVGSEGIVEGWSQPFDAAFLKVRFKTGLRLNVTPSQIQTKAAKDDREVSSAVIFVLYYRNRVLEYLVLSVTIGLAPNSHQHLAPHTLPMRLNLSTCLNIFSSPSSLISGCRACFSERFRSAIAKGLQRVQSWDSWRGGSSRERCKHYYQVWEFEQEEGQ